jgi:hypothetical protein
VTLIVEADELRHGRRWLALSEQAPGLRNPLLNDILVRCYAEQRLETAK